MKTASSEQNEFREMTALVTGASRGIGAETAFELGSRGAFVLIHYKTAQHEAQQLLGKIRAKGGDGELLQADLSCSEGVHHLIDAVWASKRPIDILVNNAGSLIRRSPFLELTEELWNQVLTLNLTSAFLLTQACLRGMVERRRGFVVSISSVAARFGGGIGSIAYSSAKGAISTMTKGLAREFAPYGIRINAVSPGAVDTHYHRQFSSPKALENFARATPMGRLGTASEIAEVVAFLCSGHARFIQGQVIEVNGGFLMV
jgi:3-oxoacyl-[acyl-carrier protein] reductase